MVVAINVAESLRVDGIYIYYKVPNDYSSAYTQKLSLILVVLLVIFSYICNFIKFRYSELKLWIILLLSLVSWQAIFQQETNNTLLHFSIMKSGII